MRIHIVSGARPFRLSGPVIIAGTLFTILGLAVAALPTGIESPVACPFRLVTGLPCPTCGLIRAFHHLLRGDVLGALATNPFDTVFLIIVAPLGLSLWAANRAFGVAVHISASARERALLCSALAATILINWAYVLLTQR